MVTTRTGRLGIYVLLLALMTVLLSACGSTSQSAPERGRMDIAPDSMQQTGSLYELDGRWRDQQGLALRLADLSGRVRVVTMIHTRCEHSCPRMLSDMKRIESALRTAGVDAGYVLISMDPAEDSPQRLAEYAFAMQLDPNSWTLLTGRTDDTRALARRLGIRYRRLDGREIAHSHVITLLDQEGRIIYRQTGLGADPATLIRAASKT